MESLGSVWKCFHCFCQSWKQSCAHEEMQPSLLIVILNQNIYCFYFFPIYIFLHAIIQTNHTPQSPGTQFIAVIERAFFFSDVLFFRERFLFVCMILLQLCKTQGKSVIKNATTLLLIFILWHFHFMSLMSLINLSCITHISHSQPVAIR